MMKKLSFLLFGMYFGFFLSRVGASNFQVIHEMFTGENLHLAGVILTAILVGHLGMKFLQIRGKQTKDGNPLQIKQKKLNRLSYIGAAIFGAGWALAGACPGTVLAQIGEGKVLGLFTLAGMLTGTYLYGYILYRWPQINS